MRVRRRGADEDHARLDRAGLSCGGELGRRALRTNTSLTFEFYDGVGEPPNGALAAPPTFEIRVTFKGEG